MFIVVVVSLVTYIKGKSHAFRNRSLVNPPRVGDIDVVDDDNSEDDEAVVDEGRKEGVDDLADLLSRDSGR